VSSQILSHESTRSCSAQLCTHINNINSNLDFISTLIGLGKLDITYNSLQCKDVITSRLLAILSSASPVDDKLFTDVVYAASLLSIKWTRLPKPLQQTILTTMAQCLDKLNAFTLTSILSSYANMNMKWSDLPPHMQSAVPHRLTSLQHEMSPQQSSKSLWALGTMGIDHRSLHSSFIDFHLDNVNSIKRSKMGNAMPASQTLTGIAKMSVDWDYCSPKTKTYIWEQFMVFNTAYYLF
jgi:hypothetical protein